MRGRATRDTSRIVLILSFELYVLARFLRLHSGFYFRLNRIFGYNVLLLVLIYRRVKISNIFS